jgi:hypothetical protein
MLAFIASHDAEGHREETKGKGEKGKHGVRMVWVRVNTSGDAPQRLPK